MKNTILSIALILLSLSSFGQRKGLWLSPNIHAGRSIFFDNAGYTNLEYKTTNAFSIGADLGYMATEHWGLFIGCSYLSNRVFNEMNNYSRYRYISQEALVGNIEAPLYIRYLSSSLNGIGFFLNVGIRNTFLLNVKRTLHTEDYSGSVEERENDDTEIYTKYKPSPFINLGVVFPIVHKYEICVGPDINFQGKDFYRKTSSGYLFTLGARASFNLQLTKHAKYSGVILDK